MLHRTDYCHHSDVDRMLRGTWCTPELVKAVENGYTLVKIHEVWHFPEHQRRTNLFADYVNTWLRLKQESTGWPSWCQTVEQKREYILHYQDWENIRLDISHIAKNPGRKATANLMLNMYLFRFFFHVVIPPLLKVSFFAVSGVNLVNGSISPPLSPSKIPPICSVYYLIPPSASALCDCAPTTSWRLSTPGYMKMRSKAPRPISSWRPSPHVTLGWNSLSL